MAGSGPYFEDFEVGRTFTGPERTLSPADVAAFAELSGDRHPMHSAGRPGGGRPLVHGPLGIACFFGWLYERGLATHVEAALDTRWRYLAPLHPGDGVRYEMTITRARRTSALVNGVIGRHVLVRDQQGVIVQEGETAALVTARDAAGDDGRRIGRAFPDAGWARHLGERLAASSAFTTATSTWDGAIGLRFGEDVVQFRIYRGRVLDAGARTPAGPAFVLGAPDITWVRLLTGPVNDFTKRTMRGEFTVSGSAYEYLRLTGALVALVDEARAFAREEAS
ncbi:MaoC/PaaZ C-terminal domain-containing protein [Pseudonocardia sp. DLS-67]